MPKKKLWDPAAMKTAVEAVRTKEMGYKKAVKLFNVPRSTLKDYVKKSDKPIEDIVSGKMGRKTVLPPELEEELVNYCLQMESNYYGVTASDLKRMAFQLAIRNNIPHPFSRTKNKAGKKWIKLFLARHPNLSFRQPESLSRARIQGFTAENVKSFFDILKPELEKIKFNPNKIFNVDETGITTVQHTVRKILTVKGKKAVHKLSSAERGALITIVTCMSASGQFIPPLMVFPRKNMKAELLDGAPPGTIAGCHPSGWIQPELFTKWLRHFVAIVKPSKEDPVLLVLDGHYSHTRNLDVIDIARDNGVSVVCLPPHSTDHMQPLDVSFMFPFKTFYTQEIERWLINHPGRVVTHYQLGEIFGRAYAKARKIDIAVNGFRETGIFPLNENIFFDSPNAPFFTNANSAASVVNDLPVPLDFTSSRPRTPTALPRLSNSSSPFIVPADIRPIPVVEPPSKSTRRGKTMVVTASPHKQKIIDAENKKKEKEERIAGKKELKM
ncbi:CENP-B homolog protein 2 [Eumeta japonica]|uniref:CENP-B homolog protein 2 n=1 Tax=Eumeta variegata TaxID=151549 RepID=A0A4C1X9Z4_EUMVA|nr:CENP-B homolog protein 2 [Eumeta japonica]